MKTSKEKQHENRVDYGCELEATLVERRARIAALLEAEGSDTIEDATVDRNGKPMDKVKWGLIYSTAFLGFMAQMLFVKIHNALKTWKRKREKSGDFL